MGLLDLLLKNQSNLDINPVPQEGNGPINPATGEFNTGVTPFQQVWDSNNTYINSFEGGQNIGIQPPTLPKTGLDIDNPNFVSSTSSPNTLTLYPATALGGLGQSAVQFLQIWTPVINYNNVVVGAPTSPLAQSLPETGLDNTDVSAVPTTVSPINTTNYPNLSTGEYNSVSTQYTQVYGPSNTYLNTYDPNVQPNSLDETGLDIENIGLVSTTAAPSTNTVYPNLSSGEFGGQSNNFNQVYTPNSTYLNTFDPNTQPNTIIQGQTGLDNINPLSSPTTTIPVDPTQYPNQSTGEFGSNSNQYSSQYGPNNTYENNYVNNPINFDTLQPTTLDETGLDNTNSNVAPTTTVPVDPTQYPQFVQGEFNGGPNLYSQIWGPTNQYIISYNPNIQPNTIIQGQTGLDNINPISAPTTTVPIDPTQYPNQSTGEFGSNSNQYTSQYGPNSTYENEYINDPFVFDTLQPSTLGQTGLDNLNPVVAPTTTIPNTPTNYPNQATGEFGGVSTQYASQYGPNNTYENTYINDLVNFDTLQSTTLNETGLDNTNPQFIPTTLVPIDNTVYPSPPQTNLGEFNGALPTTNFTPQYNPGFGYLNTYNNIITLAGNVQVNTLGQTGLDVENSNAITFTPNAVSAPTTYPALSSGEFGSVSNQYTQIWNPINQYINGYNPLTQPNTLGQTGLDNTDSNFAPTTTIPGVFTQYPQFTQGEFNGVPTQFNQIWNYNNKYIVNYNPNIQPSTLSLTGLDNTDNSAAPTTTTPSTITQYPSIATGEFGGVSNQYVQVWNSNNTYDANYNPNTQPDTLDQTGLDIEDQNLVSTTTAPSTVTQYPQFVQGEFNTAPNQYTQVWGPTNQYIVSYNPNTQPNTVNSGETGLDNTNLLAFNTTFVPNTITAPTNYPQPAQTYLGEFQGAPSQFTPLYTPNPGQSYLDNYNTIISNAGNQQVNTLGQTDLDNTNSNSSPTTVQSTDPTVYPLFVQGEFNSSPNLYNQIWNPNFGYYLNSNPSAQTDTLDETGLDLENKLAAPTTYVVPETDDTLYPVIQGAFTINRIPKPYTQTFTPTNQYYSFMIDNFEGQII